MTFFSLLIGPLYIFSYCREYFNIHYSSQKADIYSVIVVLVYMWIIIVSYIVYYFSEDFYKVFCKRANNNVDSNTKELKKEILKCENQKSKKE
jgi:hypothetical protein